MRLPAVICAGLVLSACSPRLAGPFHSPSAGPGDARRTEAARARLHDAVEAGDDRELDALLAADVVLLLPDGLERHGRAAAREWIDAVLVPASSSRGIRFELGRTRACTAALHDVGMLLVDEPGETHTELEGWHVALLWRETASGLQLGEARVYAAGNFDGYGRPCHAVPDSLFRSRRNTIQLSSSAAALVSSRLTTSMADGLSTAGWSTPLYETVAYDGQAYLVRGSAKIRRQRPVVGVVTLRRDLGRGFLISVAGLVDGGYLERSDADGLATASLDYGTAAIALQPGLTLGWLYVAGGPAFMRTAGTWHTKSVLGTGNPSADVRWNESLIGIRSTAGVLVPVSPRFALAVDGHYSVFGDVQVAPYLGMDRALVSLSDAGVTAGFAVRF